MLSNSRGPETIKELGAKLGEKVGTTSEAVKYGDIIVLAIPLGKVKDLDSQLFEGKIVIDANNYYPNRDGHIAELDQWKITSTGYTQRILSGARLVKAFNNVFWWHISPGKQQLPNGHKRALPIAGDDQEAKKKVGELLRSLGYEVYDYGGIEESWRQERGKPIYCAPVDVEGAKEFLGEAGREDKWNLSGKRLWKMVEGLAYLH
ncbi:DEKNAAC103180 [Brettanomyces naardenensis]|uniref:DEKNAAC103180 n=1 Tax=Brettanomyces naardenensis TaxID=13370 RepID=A0A448YMP3_BRENA|nr:DEKNAAC103180 [Brettanomyces naardenensis]